MDISMNISMDIHEKICGYGCGCGWEISYPRQADRTEKMGQNGQGEDIGYIKQPYSQSNVYQN